MTNNRALVPINQQLTISVGKQFSLVETLLGRSLVRDGAVPVLVPQTGSRKHIRSVAFSPDGRFVFSGDTKGICQWDLSTGYCLKRIEQEHNFDGLVWSFSSNCQFAITSNNYSITVWEIAAGKLIKEIEADDKFRSAVFLADNKTILSGHADGNLRYWDITTGNCLRKMEGHTGDVYHLDISNDGRLALSGASKDDSVSVCLWNLATGQLLQSFEGYTGYISSLVFLPNNQPALITICDLKTINFWDLAAGKCVWSRDFSFKPVVLSPDGANILCYPCLKHRGTEREKELEIWDVTTGKCKQIFKGHLVWGTAAYNSDGSKIITGGRDAMLSLWDVNSGHCTIIGDPPLAAHYAASSEEYVAFLGANETLRLWHIASNRFMTCIGGFTDSSVIFSQNGQHILSWGQTILKVWNILTGQCVKMLEGHSGRVLSAVFSSDDKYILSQSEDRTVRTWDVNSGNCIKSLTMQPGNDQPAFTPEDYFSFFHNVVKGCTVQYDTSLNHILAARGGKPLNIWGKNGDLTATFVLEGDPTTFSPDGRQLLLVGKENMIVDTVTGKTTIILEGPKVEERFLKRYFKEPAAFSPDGQSVLALAADGSLQIWNTTNGKCLHELKEYGKDTRYIAFSPDGNLAIASDTDGILQFWDVDTGDAVACMTVFDDGNWHVIAPDGRYDSSDNGESEYLRWTVGSESYPVTYFKARYHVPGLLGKVMTLENLS